VPVPGDVAITTEHRQLAPSRRRWLLDAFAEADGWMDDAVQRVVMVVEAEHRSHAQHLQIGIQRLFVLQHAVRRCFRRPPFLLRHRFEGNRGPI